MKQLSAGLLIAMLVWVTPAQAQTKDSAAAAVAAAETAAKAWLQLIDGRQFGASWDSAAKVFRDAVTRSAWESAVRDGQAPFVPLGERELLGASFQTQLPNTPPGQYVVLQYRTKARGGKNVVETITPRKEQDGRWRVAGYFIRPE